MNKNSIRRILRKSACLLAFLGWACQPSEADFYTSYEVKGKEDLVDTFMARFRESKGSGGVFTTFNRRREGLSQLVLMRRENRLPVVYVMVLHEHSIDHGENSQFPQFLTEFPMKTRVANPVFSYTLDHTKVAEPAAELASNISMISQCVRRADTNKVTYAESYLRFEFRKEEDLRRYLEAIAPLLLDPKQGNDKLYVSSARETSICAEPPPLEP